MSEQVRLAELLGALSFAGDLGRGQPMGHVLRTCRIAMTMAERAGLDTEQLADVYFTSLLVHAGCTAGAPEFAAFLAGDELRAQKDFSLCDPSNMKDLLGWMWRNVEEGGSMPARAMRMLHLMAQGEKAFEDIELGCSDVGARIAKRLGLSEGTQKALYEVCEMWNGKGPHGLAGEEIPLPARYVNVAMITEVFFSELGREAAKNAALARRAKSFDPQLAELAGDLCDDPSFWSGMEEQEPWERVLALEPQRARWVEEGQMDEVCLAMADIVDLKSASTADHSRRTAELAEALAMRIGLSEADIALTRRAALVHDVGLVAIPSLILHKETPLTESEIERYRLHPYYTERILSRSGVLRPIGAVACGHHERLDGSGFHKGTVHLTLPAQIVALASLFEERTAGSALVDAGQVLASLEATKGFDPLCLRALAEHLGAGRTPRLRRDWPADLTDREVEVLRLVASGLTVHETAKSLVVSDHTARHHLESIYSKIGVSSRAGAVLFAVENDLLTSS